MKCGDRFSRCGALGLLSVVTVYLGVVVLFLPSEVIVWLGVVVLFLPRCGDSISMWGEFFSP